MVFGFCSVVFSFLSFRAYLREPSSFLSSPPYRGGRGCLFFVYCAGWEPAFGVFFCLFPKIATKVRIIFDICKFLCNYFRISFFILSFSLVSRLSLPVSSLCLRLFIPAYFSSSCFLAPIFHHSIIPSFTIPSFFIPSFINPSFINPSFLPSSISRAILLPAPFVLCANPFTPLPLPVYFPL